MDDALKGNLLAKKIMWLIWVSMMDLVRIEKVSQEQLIKIWEKRLSNDEWLPTLNPRRKRMKIY